MPVISPPTSSGDAFKRGQACLERRTYQESAAYFQLALDLEKQEGEGAKNSSMKFLSYLGLALNLGQVRSEEGLKMCEQAVKRDFFDPDLFCNLGIVYLRCRQRGAAFRAFDRGLKLRPKHRRILEELDKYDRRSRPVFGFLSRTNPVNVMAGRMRARVRDLLGRFAPTEA